MIANMMKNKKISFLLPTKRDPSNFVNNVINNINSFQSSMSYEICVFSKEEVVGENVVWYKEEELKGQIYAYNYMAKNCQGEYLVCLTDDHILTNSFEHIINYLETDFKDKKFKITSLHPPGGFCGNPKKGDLCGDRNIDFECDYYSLIRFPVLHYSALDQLDGVLFNSQFIHHAGDIWLGFYMGINGQPGSDGPTYIAPFNQVKDASTEVQDCNICRLLIEKSTREKISYNHQL